MIADHDRSGYFGASDVRYIIGNTKTASFEKWWQTKLGLCKSTFTNDAMMAGTHYEHKILEFLAVPELDKQIILPELLLRVNYDGTGENEITEVKTYGWGKEFKPPKHYVEQVNVQMYAWYKTYGVLPAARIAAYGLEREDYRNFCRDIDPARMSIFPIEYDQKFIDTVFLPRLTAMAAALKEGRWFS